MFFQNNILILDSDERPDETEIESISFPPYRFEGLNINGEKFDLRDYQQVEEGLRKVKEYRKLLKTGDLETYDNKSTEKFGGGRNNLNYDEIRLKIAEDYHKGKHSLSFEEQHSETKRIQDFQNLKWTKK